VRATYPATVLLNTCPWRSATLRPPARRAVNGAGASAGDLSAGGRARQPDRRWSLGERGRDADAGGGAPPRVPVRGEGFGQVRRRSPALARRYRTESKPTLLSAQLALSALGELRAEEARTRRGCWPSWQPAR